MLRAIAAPQCPQFMFTMMAVDMPKRLRASTRDWFQWTHSKCIDVGVCSGKTLISTFSETLMGRVTNQEHFLPQLEDVPISRLQEDIDDNIDEDEEEGEFRLRRN